MIFRKFIYFVTILYGLGSEALQVKYKNLNKHHKPDSTIGVLS